MDSFLGKLKSAADKAGVSASVAQEKIIQEYLPKIVAVLREKAGPAVLEILSDIDKLGDLARTAYQALPMPVRIVVKEQSFIDWVISHQDKLIELIQAQIEKVGTSGDPANTLAPAEAEVPESESELEEYVSGGVDYLPPFPPLDPT